MKAADLLKEYLDIQFVLVGSGSAKSELQNMVKERGLNNVTFIDPIPKVQIQAMLCELDICFIGLTKDPLFRFGVSPNKLYDYLYSGKPIIYAIESGAYQPVSELGAGLQVEAESPSAISNAVLSLFSMTAAQRVQMGVNAKKAVLEDYEYGVLAKKLEQVLFG
ncbi:MULTISPECIES: glycosyltransferase [Pseudomonas]|uniref:glycosyltransferase n=1 Tax=Pseudomonas TaxID=286 RepID=UPI0015ACC445|nr:MULTISPECIES: glycosyltransferase [Pseudomonas]